MIWVWGCIAVTSKHLGIITALCWAGYQELHHAGNPAGLTRAHSTTTQTRTRKESRRRRGNRSGQTALAWWIRSSKIRRHPEFETRRQKKNDMKTANKQILGGGGAEGARVTGQGKLLQLEEMAR
ncbi:Actin-like protein [Fusarium oxysporum f. sp. albedinis]|nr:Actin-like protein [Fusarium oxysporum f. sp. albedinis]